MSLDLILDICRKIVDIAIVWILIYTILKNIKSNVKLSLLFKGILFIIIIKIIADYAGLVTVGLLLEYVIQWGPLALIIIFQPEIRSILEQIGKTQLLGRHKVLTVDEDNTKRVYEAEDEDLDTQKWIVKKQDNVYNIVSKYSNLYEFVVGV